MAGFTDIRGADMGDASAPRCQSVMTECTTAIYLCVINCVDRRPLITVMTGITDIRRINM